MADKNIQLVSGKLTEVEATVVSAGAGNAGEVVALDSTGRLDNSVLPVGVGADTKIIEASENIGAGKYVNIFDDAGTAKIRLASNDSGRDAHGFLKDAVLSAANGTVFFEGPNDDLTGLTIGARYYLSTAGGVTATPPTSPGATISQFVGIAVSATEINTDIDDCGVLA